MAIHLTRILSLCKIKPYLLASFVSRRHLQEFPDLRFNNAIPKDYVLLLPEPLNETPQTNQTLRLPKFGSEIDFSKLDTFSVYKGLSQTINLFEDFLSDIDEGRISFSEKSFSEFLKEIERRIYPMDTAYNVLTAIASVDSKNYDYKEILDLLKRYLDTREKRFRGKVRTQVMNYAKHDRDSLSEADLRMLEIYHGKNLKRVSMSPGDEKTLSLYQKSLFEDKTKFQVNLNGANQLFSHTVDDPDILTVVAPEFDDCQNLHHKERTPLKITAATYQKFMRACPDRFVRRNLWQHLNKRCSPKALPKFNNLSTIQDIRTARRKIADLCGYRTHVDYKLKNALAESRSDILESLALVNSENSKKLADRLQELNDYAADNSFEDPGQLGIQEYDIDFWTHKYKYDILIGKSEAELKNYFPFKAVMKGLLNYFENYFGLEFTCKLNQQHAFWDESVQSYLVSRNNQPLGTIILDPFQRPEKLQNILYARIRGRSEVFDCLPVRMISASCKSHLTVTDTMNLFYCYGTVLQRLLYNYDHYELNIYGGFENEVINLLPNLCVAHLLTDHRILQSCSDRGNSKFIDSELAPRILKALTYFKSFNTWHQLYQAHLDLEAHSNLTDIRTLVREIHPIYSPFMRDPDDYDFCSMDNVFVGPSDGTLYADLWSKCLANFCMSETLTEDGDMSSIDVGKIRSFNVKLLDTLFDSSKLKIEPKLVSLIGRCFKGSEPSLGVL